MCSNRATGVASAPIAVRERPSFDWLMQQISTKIEMCLQWIKAKEAELGFAGGSGWNNSGGCSLDDRSRGSCGGSSGDEVLRVLECEGDECSEGPSGGLGDLKMALEGVSVHRQSAS